MKRFFSLILALTMVLGLLPTLAVGISAGEAVSDKPTEQPVTIVNGDYSLTVNKTQFSVGEPILVSAKGTGTDWVGIYSAEKSTSIRWEYIDPNNGGVGVGVEFDMRQTSHVEDNTLAPLGEGEYYIRLQPNNTSNLSQTKALIKIRVGNPNPIIGDSARLSLDKYVYKKGEPIYVSAVGSGNDWVGLYATSGIQSLKWQYVRNMGSEPYDITAGQSYNPGTYIIRLLPNDATDFSLTVAYATVTIVDDYNVAFDFEYNAQPDVGGDGTDTTDSSTEDIGTTDSSSEDIGTTDSSSEDIGTTDSSSEDIGTTDSSSEDIGTTDSSEENGGTTDSSDDNTEPSDPAPLLSVEKTEFFVGEPIYVTALKTYDLDWVGIFKPDGNYVKWHYVGMSSGQNTRDPWAEPGVAYDVTQGYKLPAGEYSIRLIPANGAKQTPPLARIDIVVREYSNIPSAPTEAEYNRTGNNNYAGGTVSVTLDVFDNRAIYMWWANENGKISGYTPIRFEATGVTTTYTITESTVIPNGATELWVYAFNKGTQELSLDCVKIDVGETTPSEQDKKPITSFFVVSDIHIGSGATSSINFQKMLREAIAMNPDGIAIYVVGDMTENGYASQYELMMSLYNEVMESEGKSPKCYPLYLTLGNHDYSSANSSFLEYAVLPNGSRPEDTSYDFWLNGYHYIFLGSDYGSGKDATFMESTLEWLDEKLNQCRDEARPSFVFLHQSIYNTVAGSLPGENWHGVTNADALIAVLSKYPEAIMFNGHSHWEMDSLSNKFEGSESLPNHIFNCASVSYLWNTKGEEVIGSQGYYVEIYEDCAVIRGRDFKNSLWVAAAQYSIELQKSQNDSHSYCQEELSYENGYMSAGTLTYTCEYCGSKKTTPVEAIFTFSGYSISTYSTSFICVGYTIEYGLLDKYQELNGTVISVGFVAAPFDSLLSEGKPINGDGTVGAISSGKILKYDIPRDNKYVSLIMRSKDWTEYSEKRVILCLYVIENGSVGYICDTDEITETALPITYGELAE